jgi:hypothetical protein
VANKKPPTPSVPPSNVGNASPNVGASTSSATLATAAATSTGAGAGAGAGAGNTDAHGAGLTIDDFNK